MITIITLCTTQMSMDCDREYHLVLVGQLLEENVVCDRLENLLLLVRGLWHGRFGLFANLLDGLIGWLVGGLVGRLVSVDVLRANYSTNNPNTICQQL
jgi:hypothetical protein